MILLGKASKLFLFLAVASLLATSIFGITHASMSMDANGDMSRCLLMPGMTALCNMTPLEHVAAWQSMFTTMAAESAVTLILLLIFAAVVFVYGLSRGLYTEPRAPLRYRQPALLFCRSPLQEAFSNGILNTKAF